MTEYRMRPRYLLWQPSKSLEGLAIEKLAGWVTSLTRIMSTAPILHRGNVAEGDAWLTQQVDTIRDYLERDLPKMLYDSLAAEVLRALEKMSKEYKLAMVLKRYWANVGPEQINLIPEQGTVIARMIETVFTKSLTSLSFAFDGFPAPCSTTLFSTFHTLTGLVQLTLYSPRHFTEAAIIRLLKQLRNIKNLTLRLGSICTEETLKCIVKNCKLIEVLDLSKNRCVNDHNIVMLADLPNLRNINVIFTAVSDVGIAKLLLCCDKIEHLDTGEQVPKIKVPVDNNHIANAIKYIRSFEEYSDKRFKLKYYRNCRFTTVEELRLVVKMCPLIESVYITKLRSRPAWLMLALNDLKFLRQVVLSEAYFYADNVVDFLQARGRNLVELTFIGVHELDLNALKTIIDLCPNLQSFHMRCCNFTYEDSKCDSYPLKPTKIKSLAVDSLIWQSRPTYDQVFFLIWSCPNVEFLSAGLDISITDEVMLKILERNPLVHLKELRMVDCKMTMVAIEKIIQSCLNCPEVIIG